MAFSTRRNAIATVFLSAVACAAIAQDQNRLPITVEAQSTDFDYQNSVLVFNHVTIVQGAVRIMAERAQASGLDFEDSVWEFSGSVRMKLTDGELASDTARVRFAKGEIQSATVTGAPATFEQRREASFHRDAGIASTTIWTAAQLNSPAMPGSRMGATRSPARRSFTAPGPSA